MDWAAGLFPGFFPDVAVRQTRMPVRRTSRRPGTAKCPNGPRMFLSATATATATSLNHAPAGSPAAPLTTASTRLHCRPTVPVPVRPADRSALTPAVAYDGDLVVSRRTLAPGLVRRAGATPCVLLATAPWNRSSQQPAAAALTMRSSTSPHTVSQTPRYHTQRTLSSPNSTQLHSARLFHTAAAHCKIRAFSSTVYTHLSSLAKFLRKPTKTCASHVSTLSPDLTDSHKADLSGHARAQATTAYTWCQKINTTLQADSLTTATPHVKVHVSTWRAVLTIAASP